MSDEAFNLIERRWIPARRSSGARDWIAPWEITAGIDDDPFVRFDWPRPDFDGASHEFLIGLLATAAAPADEDAWHEWAEKPPAPEVLHERFRIIADAFNLDGPGPRFMQDMDELEQGKDWPIDRLLIDGPGEATEKKNTDLFSKRDSIRAMSLEATSIALFTLQTYSPAGGSGHCTSIRGGGPLTTLVVTSDSRGQATVWMRLWPNVENREAMQDRAVGSITSGSNIFPWMTKTRSSGKNGGGTKTTQADVHPLQVYWGMPRRIQLKLASNEMGVCDMTARANVRVVRGLRMQTYGTQYDSGTFDHPLSPYHRHEKVRWLPVKARVGAGGYRDWLGQVIIEHDSAKPARGVQYSLDRGTPHSRLAAFGYEMGKASAQAWVAAEKPLLIASNTFVRGVLAETISALVRAARIAAEELAEAIKIARALRRRVDWVEDRFWRETESAFFESLAAAQQAARAAPGDDDPAKVVRENWRGVIERAALALFDELAPTDGIENGAMRRVVAARYRLVGTLRGWSKQGNALLGALGLPIPVAATGNTKRGTMSKASEATQ